MPRSGGHMRYTGEQCNEEHSSHSHSHFVPIPSPIPFRSSSAWICVTRLAVAPRRRICRQNSLFLQGNLRRMVGMVFLWDGCAGALVLRRSLRGKDLTCMWRLALGLLFA